MSVHHIRIPEGPAPSSSGPDVPLTRITSLGWSGPLSDPEYLIYTQVTSGGVSITVPGPKPSFCLRLQVSSPPKGRKTIDPRSRRREKEERNPGVPEGGLDRVRRTKGGPPVRTMVSREVVSLFQGLAVYPWVDICRPFTRS